MEKQIEQSRYLITRFDNYISYVNVKGNFLIAFNTFLTGGVIVNYSNLTKFICCCNGIICLKIFLVVLVLLCLIATVFVIKAVYPFLSSGNSTTDKYHSHIFFKSITEFKDNKEFYESLSKQTDENLKEDLAKQAYQLSISLCKKYKNLENAMCFIYGELAILFAILLTVIFG